MICQHLLVREKAVSGANKIFGAEAPRGQAKVNFVDDDDVVDNDGDGEVV